MNESGQSAARLRTGLHAIASWIGLRRLEDEGAGEDLLADPVPDSVEFTSLSPLTSTNQSGRLFSQITNSWIRRHCDPFLYETANLLVSSSNVVLISAGKERLTGKVCDGTVFGVEISFEHGGISGLCQCESFHRRKATASSGDKWLTCAHIAALVQYVVVSNLVPQSSPGEQAAVCPITRLPLDSGRMIYRCERCQLSYTEEGWQFLKEKDRGRCCGCRARNCIHLLDRDQQEQHGGAA